MKTNRNAVLINGTPIICLQEQLNLEKFWVSKFSCELLRLWS